MSQQRPTVPDPRERLGERLRALHLQTGKSLRQLEPIVHASDSSLSRYFRGTTVPAWAVVERLCSAAGVDPDTVRPLWNQACDAQRPDVDDEEDDADMPAAARPRAWREHRPGWFLATAVLVSAVVFAAAGLIAGARLFPVTVTATATPTGLDQACKDWPWPTGRGTQVITPAHPISTDHAPAVTLEQGTVEGRMVVWAQLTNARYGDRVWIDVADRNAVTPWTQCGPFLATSETAASHAHILDPALKFRACADTPTPQPSMPRNACTKFW